MDFDQTKAKPGGGSESKDVELDFLVRTASESDIPGLLEEFGLTAMEESIKRLIAGNSADYAFTAARGINDKVLQKKAAEEIIANKEGVYGYFARRLAEEFLKHQS
ncbi:MAG TPA: hypothetical protein VMD74_00620 [Candidatus Methylomirabilis sp.]|nr:hypothetical protein [Candidatus Methylomirabilis sp.]